MSFFSNATALDLLEEVFHGSAAATKINRNARKAIFSQITPIVAEKK
ncbi:hypothetical protein ACX8XP_04020 [Calditrichota bacterium LG25]